MRCYLFDIVALAAFLSFGVPSAQARHSTVYGPGTASCAEWTAARDNHTREELGFVYWVGGYVSGYNAFANNETAAESGRASALARDPLATWLKVAICTE